VFCEGAFNTFFPIYDWFKNRLLSSINLSKNVEGRGTVAKTDKQISWRYAKSPRAE
jgi:hypothetical protein